VPIRLAKKQPTRQYENLDASESVYFGQQLALIKQKAYEYEYGQLLARKFIPAATETDPNAKVIIFHTYDRVGVAKIIANYADDLPRADVKGSENIAWVKTLGASYGYNVDEISTAAANGMPLEQKRANAAKQAIEQSQDQIAATGNAANNLVGFLNQSNTLLYTVPNGVGGFATWASKTPDEILKDLNGIVTYQVKQTKQNLPPTNIIVPLTQYAQISTTPRSATTDTTILDFFLRNQQYVKTVESWESCAGAGSGGTDRMVSYRKDLDVLELHIPMEFFQHNPQERNLEVVIPCRAKTAGVLVFKPLGITYGDGI
jgi:hypothetical protein